MIKHLINQLTVRLNGSRNEDVFVLQSVVNIKTKFPTALTQIFNETIK